ncbi:MAG TPA: hypothetical protein PK076_02480 [Saprospiraceae bacterium]|nr:hypothetical protein [Saprospiraceae bacterium]HQW54959.1 hypothetical protein [Saprospiraceae bacterium]
MRKLTFITLLIIAIGNQSFGQKKAIPEKGLLVHFEYGWHLPSSDLKNRFGNNFTLGSAIEYKFNNWFGGLSYHYIFGNTVKEAVLANLLNDRGEIIGIDGHLANITLQERGFMSSLYIGRLIPLSVNRQHNIKVSIGGGIMQHKIKVTEEYNVVPQIVKDYIGGYDRLSNGPMVEESIGYQYLSTNKRINFNIGLVFRQGFTAQRRIANYVFDQPNNTPLNSKRLDLLNGVQVSWILPFYFNDSPDEIIY